jgi:hypothetical protein
VEGSTVRRLVVSVGVLSVRLTASWAADQDRNDSPLVASTRKLLQSKAAGEARKLLEQLD